MQVIFLEWFSLIIKEQSVEEKPLLLVWSSIKSAVDAISKGNEKIKKTITKHTGIKKSVLMSLDWNVNVCSHHSTPAGFYSKWTEILLSRVYGKIWVVNARHNVSIFNNILDLFLHFSPPKVYLSENPITFMKHPPD